MKKAVEQNPIFKCHGLTLVVLMWTTMSWADVVLTVGGDLNLAQSNHTPFPDQACKNGRCYSWSQVFSGLEPLLTGELNFFNLETTLTDGRPPLSPQAGKYVFRTHLEGIRYAQSIGLNWASLANNHIGDYGQEGMIETIESVETLNREASPMHFHGLARTREEILKPTIIDFMSLSEGRVRIAFAAVTFVRNAPIPVGEDKPGVIYPENERDMNELLKNMRNADVDFRVLSIHWGTERQVELNSGQQSRYHKYLQKGDVDLILGHHPHRVRPVERVGDRLIFYSLGNYLMLGAESLNRNTVEHNYGLMGRLYLKRHTSGQLKIRYVEAIPLFNVHVQSYALKDEEARSHIEALNDLSFRELGTSAVNWLSLPNGWGGTCFSNCREVQIVPLF
jgi:hypothetical protein